MSKKLLYTWDYMHKVNNECETHCALLQLSEYKYLLNLSRQL